MACSEAYRAMELESTCGELPFTMAAQALVLSRYQVPRRPRNSSAKICRARGACHQLALPYIRLPKVPFVQDPVGDIYDRTEVQTHRVYR